MKIFQWWLDLVFSTRLNVVFRRKPQNYYYRVLELYELY